MSGRTTGEPGESAEAPQPQPLNFFFKLAAVAGVLFVLTVCALTALMFSGPVSPAAVFLQEHGGFLIAAEVAAILVFGILAMAADRREIVREFGDNRKEEHPGVERQASTGSNPANPQRDPTSMEDHKS